MAPSQSPRIPAPSQATTTPLLPSPPSTSAPRRVPLPLPLLAATRHRTSAEIYAAQNGGGFVGSRGAAGPAGAGKAARKPILDWISRKLGARRATVSEVRPRARAGSATFATAAPDGVGVSGPSTWRHRDGGRSPARVNPRAPRSPRSVSSRDTHSVRSYSFSHSARRQEINNPYPSLPIPLTRPRYASTMGDGSDSRPPSASILSRDADPDADADGLEHEQDHAHRSRSPSLASALSMPASLSRSASVPHIGRPRVMHTGTDGEHSPADSLRLAGRADEDASVRPIAPSHPASPAPSTSGLSRSFSTSASMLGLAPSPSPHPLSPSPHTPARAHRRDTLSSSTGMAASFVSSAFESNHPFEAYEPFRPGSALGSSSARSRQTSVASTKPTTIVSIDSVHPAHIAVAGPSSPLRHTAVVSSAPSTQAPTPTSPTRATMPPTPFAAMAQAPKHTVHHPSANPAPSLPPAPNASTQTLASSVGPVSLAAPSSWSVRARDSPAFPAPAPPPAIPTATVPTPPRVPATLTHRPSHSPHPSVAWADERARPSSMSISADRSDRYEREREREARDRPADYAPSLSAYAPSLAASAGLSLMRRSSRGAIDEDASVRAVRRRGSWESGESRWSWRAGAGVGAGAGWAGAGSLTPGTLATGLGVSPAGPGSYRPSSFARDSWRRADEDEDAPVAIAV
ncbi:hypothetical protein Q5752_000036 [Cryptotrichosporon argae]